MVGFGVQRSSPPAIGERGACAAGHPAEVDAALQILDAGGNAVDAAVAAAFAGFVVEQHDCGLGGFARVSVWLEEPQKFLSFDGYVCAPERARADMFELQEAHSYYGHPETVGDAARYGALAPAVPGAVAALCQARDVCGSKELGEIMAPAIALADQGHPFGWREALVIAQLQEEISRLPETARVLLPGGRVPRIAVQNDDAQRMDCSALAATLRRIACGGASEFYTGKTARMLGAFLRDVGGIMDEGDLERYRALPLQETPARFANADYISCGDHVSYEALNILEGMELGAADEVSYRHAMAESLGAAFTDVLAHYGDPAHVPCPAVGLASPGFARMRRGQLEGSRALPRPIEPANPWPFDPGHEPADAGRHAGPAARGGTSQMVAADRQGNIASIITAVGWNYGSLMYDPGTGIFLNNGMLYFDPRPGCVASIAPGKRPLFGAPVIVARDAESAYAIAGSGGYRIQSGVLHTLVNQLRHGMSLRDAVEAPRVHCQGRETYVDARIPQSQQHELQAMGHQVVALPEDASTLHFGRVAAITRNGRTGVLEATSSPQWMSAVGAI